MAGGGPGQRGLNLIRFVADNRTISLGGKNTISVSAGDRLLIHSPGGGGYGPVDSTGDQKQDQGHAVGSVGDASAGAGAGAAHSVPSRMTSGSLYQYSLNQESV